MSWYLLSFPQELIRQLAVEKTSVIKRLGGMRVAEYASMLPEDSGAALRDVLQRADVSEQAVSRQASRNTNLSLALLDQSSRTPGAHSQPCCPRRRPMVAAAA